ncbi:sensor histidine kinase [Paenibacillus sp. GCM10027626]|uniref:sensor histidine kinase n=1 Tax=Paenibacillus sp. GCM10027626 TaxID=3273411 RepID=UPI00363F4306
MMVLAIGFSWSVAYTAVAFVKEKQQEPALIAELKGEARLISRVAADTADETARERLLADIAQTKKLHIYLAERSDQGTVSHFGGEAAGPASFRISEEDARQVEQGAVVDHIQRSKVTMDGYAIVGVPLELDHLTGSLWIREDIPGIFTGYGRQLLNVYLGIAVLFLIVLIMRPWRKGMQGWVEIFTALRRVSKGDFKFKLQQNKHMPGQLGELVKIINTMTEGLNQMEEVRQTFISNVSHEIQSPLTSIRGFARALQQEGLSQEQRRHYYNIIETESGRLSKLSDNLLKLTSLESERHPFEPKPYRLDKQLRSIVLVCEPQWLEKDITIDIELAETTIEADQDLLSQVWMNLISNSIKFTPQGGTIAVAIDRRGAEVAVTISDSGSGIPPADLPFIFERFYKADKARERAAGGSGLGLSIVKRIVEMHGGSVSAASPSVKFSRGTDIRVVLPRRL